MRLSCDKQVLNEAVMAAARAASQKSSLPSLTGILLEAKDNLLRLTGYNLEMGITCVVDAQVEEEGSVILDAYCFGEIIRKVSGDIVNIKTENFLANIKSLFSEFNITGMDPAEFPQLPAVDEQRSVALPQDMLKSMIRQTLFAVSTSEAKPVHTGALFEIKAGRLKVIGVDGFRLAVRQEQLSKETQDMTFIIPGKTLSELLKLLPDSENEAVIKIGKKHISFILGNTVIISRLLEGEFLNYENVIPRQITLTVKIETKRVVESIEALSVLINEKLKSPIRCVVADGKIKLTTKTATGNGEEDINAKIEGDDIEIGFNNRFMLDALKASESEELVLEFASHLYPIVIKPAKGDKFIFLVLPVRLKND